MAPECEFPVAEYQNPACELLGGASHTAGSHGPPLICRDSTRRFENGDFESTGLVNIDAQMRLQEEEFEPAKASVDMHSRCGIAS
jgi:hypothetical protein